MNIYTSYFGNIRKLEGLTPISIARYKPRYLYMSEYKALAPAINMLKMIEAEYVPLFDKILNELNPETVIKDLLRLTTNGKDIVLLCYEKPPEFCHRHLVASWLNDKLNIKITEF